ncbi:MAG: FkbM family methyltransferase [Candidatus Macondimonas sp.]
MDWRSQWGLARSFLLYRARPGRRRRLAAFYRPWIGPDSLCFDIGAHLGDRVDAWRRLGARVVAVEPQPLFRDALVRRYRDDARVCIEPVALAEAPGRQILSISRRTPTVSTLNADWRQAMAASDRFSGVRWDASCEVEVMTLDTLIARHGVPGFCKLDVEGAEAQILGGLSQPLPALSLEYSPAAIGGALACVARLAALGSYRFQRSVGESLRFEPGGWREAPEALADLRAVPRHAPAGDLYAVRAG